MDIKILGIDSTDPKAHVKHIGKYLAALKDHCRHDIKVLNDPSATALFETTAEVLGGLEKAMNDFHAKNENAWRDESAFKKDS